MRSGRLHARAGSSSGAPDRWSSCAAAGEQGMGVPAHGPRAPPPRPAAAPRAAEIACTPVPCPPSPWRNSIGVALMHPDADPETLVRWDHQCLWHPFTQMADWLAEEPLVIAEA